MNSAESEKKSAKAGLYLNIRRQKIMTTEKIQNFNIDNEYIKIVRDFTYLERAVTEEL